MIKNNKKKEIIILHVIEKLNDEEGGLYNVVENLCRFLPKNKNLVLADQIKNQKILKHFNNNVFNFNSLIKKIKFIKKKDIDIIHIHGIWSPINTLASLAAIFFKKPFIVSPQGMLEPWSLNEKKIKKYIFLHLVWKYIFKKANEVIFTSKQEYINFKKIKLVKKLNYKIIPNGFWINKNRISIKKNKFNTLLYLSRLHKKKGILDLIEAFKELNPQKWKLKIVGSGEKKFIDNLKNKTGKNLINKKIFFYGFKNNIHKIKFFQNSDIFVLPSYSENFGIVVAEALSFGLPVLTTKATPWSHIKLNNCGWWITPGKENLKNCLKIIFNNDINLKKMGKNAKILSEKFIWSKVAKKFEKVYLNYYNK